MNIAETIIYIAAYKGEETPSKLIKRVVRPEDAAEVLSKGIDILKLNYQRCLSSMHQRYAREAQRFTNFREDVFRMIGPGGEWAKTLARYLRGKYGSYSTKGQVLVAARTFENLRVIKQDTGSGEAIDDAIFRAPRAESPPKLEEVQLV